MLCQRRIKTKASHRTKLKIAITFKSHADMASRCSNGYADIWKKQPTMKVQRSNQVQFWFCQADTKSSDRPKMHVWLNDEDAEVKHYLYPSTLRQLQLIKKVQPQISFNEGLTKRLTDRSFTAEDKIQGAQPNCRFLTLSQLECRRN